MKTLIVDINQSIWDLAIQAYGDPSAVKQLIIDNPTLNFNDSVTAGTTIKIGGEPINKNIVDYLTKKGLKPTTAWNDPDEGHDYFTTESGMRFTTEIGQRFNPE